MMMNALLAACLALQAVPPLPGAGAPPAEVESMRDVRYYDGEGASERKHLLDVYRPIDASGAPVLMFVHGGAWSSGDRSLYGWLGERFASDGFVVAIPSYRLSPDVQHPEHIRDVARAFAWVHQHIADYGGDPANIFIMGHSAGGHLVALLATDERWLTAHELTTDAIRGVIPVSGVYTAFGPMFQEVFGSDAEARQDALPVEHVDDAQPPFLIIWGDRDMISLPAQGRRMAQRLEQAGSPVGSLEVEDRTHMTILSQMRHENDPAHVAALEFMRERLAEAAAGADGDGGESEGGRRDRRSDGSRRSGRSGGR